MAAPVWRLGLSRAWPAPSAMGRDGNLSQSLIAWRKDSKDCRNRLLRRGKAPPSLRFVAGARALIPHSLRLCMP